MRNSSTRVLRSAALCLLLPIVALPAAERTERTNGARGDRAAHGPARRTAVDLGSSYDPAYDPNAGIVPECVEPADAPLVLGGLLGGAVVEPVYCPDDACPATCSNAIPISVPGSATLSIDPPIVIPGAPPIRDVEWISFDVPYIEPGRPYAPLVGQVVRIETTASCTSEADCSTATFDTALSLYRDCDPTGRWFPLVVDGDGGLGWLSAIDGQGYCVVEGRVPCDGPDCPEPERCIVDADCQRSAGGPQSHAFCASALCLSSGTYYVMAWGEFGASPPSFDLRVSKIGTCPIPRADGYESDDTGRDATGIGWPSSIPGNGNGRANREVQGHTIVVDDAHDIDFLRVEPAQDEVVRFSTAVTQPRPSNGYFYRPASWESDTEMSAQYADGALGQAGVCNHTSAFRAGSFVDLGCSSSQTNLGIRGLGPDEDPNGCLAGLPWRFLDAPSNWCVPNHLVGFLAANFANEDNPFVTHDDNDPSRGDLGSTIELCLPAEGRATQPANPIVVGVTTSSLSATTSSSYSYEARAQTLTPCTFEREPNQTPFEASPIDVDQEVFGLNDTSTTRRTSVITPVRRCSTAPGQRCYATPRPPGPNRWPTILDVCPSGGTCTGDPLEGAVTVGGFHDFDWWGPFDVDAETWLQFRLEPQIIDPQADTRLQLRVGPLDVDGDGFDDFPLLAEDVNSGTSTPPSTFDRELGPAARYWGLNPHYYLVAGILTNRGDSGSSIPDHYYKLSISRRLPLAESEPNDDCRSTSQVATIGETWRGALSPSGGVGLAEWGVAQDGDLDAYRITVAENTRVSFSTDGDPATTDTALQIESCGSGTVLACDEDGQFRQHGTYGSLIQGCLAPGEYCVRVRAWAGLGPEYGMNEHYTLRFTGTPGCDPVTDPVLGDGAGSCRPSSGSSGPFDAGLDGDGNGSPARTACGVPLD